MKTAIIILALTSTLAFAGCKKDRKGAKPPRTKPPVEETQKVPDAPSGLGLSAIAIAALGAYAMMTKGERHEC